MEVQEEGTNAMKPRSVDMTRWHERETVLLSATRIYYYGEDEQSWEFPVGPARPMTVNDRFKHTHLALDLCSTDHNQGHVTQGLGDKIHVLRMSTKPQLQ